MKLTIYTEFQQNSPVWDIARLGVPTASCFNIVMRQGGRGKDGASLTREKYMNELAAELITGKPTVRYRNAQMDRGHEWEPDAREAYLAALPITAGVARPAFIRAEDGAFVTGCSPDTTVRLEESGSGGCEIKTLEPHLMVKHLRNPDVPQEYRTQIDGLIWLTDSKWWDLVLYSEGFPMWKHRVFRDDDRIKDLEAGVRLFHRELADVVLSVTGETITTLRKRRLAQLNEAIAEGLGASDETVAEGAPVGGGTVPGGSGITADLQASLERG